MDDSGWPFRVQLPIQFWTALRELRGIWAASGTGALVVCKNPDINSLTGLQNNTDTKEYSRMNCTIQFRDRRDSRCECCTKSILFMTPNTVIKKRCWVCETTFEASSLAEMRGRFGKDTGAKDGLLNRCLACNRNLHRAYREKNRDKETARVRRYEKNNADAKRREQVRNHSRKRMGSAAKMDCKKCGNAASHWHHVKYEAQSVVPLCRECHSREHHK